MTQIKKSSPHNTGARYIESCQYHNLRNPESTIKKYWESMKKKIVVEDVLKVRTSGNTL